MRDVTTYTNQVYSPFGGGYVYEQSLDETQRNIAAPEVGVVISALTVSMFEEILKSLRSSLCLR